MRTWRWGALAMAALLASMLVGPGRTADAVNPPGGFTDVTIATDINKPSWMEVAPDGRLFVATGAAIRRIEIYDDNGFAGTFITLPDVVNLETGIVGLAFDPSFQTNGVVYIARLLDDAAGPQRFRLSQFDSDGFVADPQSEQVLLEFDDPNPTRELHQGGDVEFGPDGKLYWALGDRILTTIAQDLGSAYGKVLRINTDGSIPTDNPFYAQTSGQERAIYALGLRNPWRMVPQPGTGTLYMSEVGPGDWEEINRLQYGANYGWPTVTGPGSGDPRFVDPDHAYMHDPEGCAVVGADFYHAANPQFPAEYHGDLFYADHCFGWIAHFDPITGEDTRFSTSAHRLVDLKVHPVTGALYYLDREHNGDTQGTKGGIGRIDYVGGDLGLQITSPPLPATVAQGETAQFGVSAIGEPPLEFQWFRDGSLIAGETSTTLLITDPSSADDGADLLVRVRDASGAEEQASAILTVTANHAPTPTISSPTSGTSYEAGQTIVFSGGAIDAEDGPIPTSNLQWDIVFHHNIHTHLFLPEITGVSGGSFVIPTVGETDSDVWYRVHLTATDSDGATRTVTSDLLPLTADVTVTTAPIPLDVQLDGTTLAAPVSFTGVVGIERTITAPSPQTVGATPYQFTSWSDGGAVGHVITIPPAAQTFTAAFSPLATTPTIEIASPDHREHVSAPVTFVGTAGDDGGVESVVLIIRKAGTNLYWNGATEEFEPGWHKADASMDAPGSSSTGWSYTFDPGESVDVRVAARARDGDGNNAFDRQRNTVGLDLDITLVDPAHQSTSDRPVAVSGTVAQGAAPITAVFVVIKQVGGPLWWDGSAWSPSKTQLLAAYDGAQATFTYDFDPGEAGSARIYARVKDEDGVVGQSPTHLVTYG